MARDLTDIFQIKMTLSLLTSFFNFRPTAPKCAVTSTQGVKHGYNRFIRSYCQTRNRQQSGLHIFKSILPDTRAYDGCISIDVYQNMDAPETIVLVEKWESRAHQEKYMGWRSETGVVDKIVSQIDGAPSIRYFDLADA